MTRVFCKIENGVVTDRVLFGGDMPADWPDAAAYVENSEAQIGWAHISGAFVDPHPPSAPPLTQKDYAAAIQAHVDATAKSKGYADGVALASYIASTIPSWQGEAAVFVPWRDSVWLQAYLIMGQVQSGQRQPPTIEDLIAELPVINWPGA